MSQFSGVANAKGRGIAISVGLNAVDPTRYGGWEGTLTACENDARDMTAIAKANGFAVVDPLLTKAATIDAVIAAIRSAAGQLEDGDIFMICYSGHGDQIADSTAPPEDKGLNQSWCLYDGELLDKELYVEWSHFKKGVRILVFSDSCHSEGITKAVPEDYIMALTGIKNGPADPGFNLAMARIDKLTTLFEAETVRLAAQGKPRVKAVPPKVSVRAQIIQNLKNRVKNVPRPAGIDAWVLSLSACRNAELAGDGDTNSIFTAAVKDVWNSGAFTGSYTQFHAAVAAAVLKTWDAQHATTRMKDADHAEYYAQRPFTLAAP